jgi:hypothetical protein
VIIWATGFEEASLGIKRLIAPGDTEGMKPVWKVDEEGELGGIWQDSGVKGLYVMMGTLPVRVLVERGVHMDTRQSGARTVSFEAPDAPYVGFYLT